MQIKQAGRKSEISLFNKLLITARTDNASPVKLKVAFISKDAVSFASDVTLTNQLQTFEVPLGDLKVDSFLLLPRPYPGFQPLWFATPSLKNFVLENADKLQISIRPEVSGNGNSGNLEIESVFLTK